MNLIFWELARNNCRFRQNFQNWQRQIKISWICSFEKTMTWEPGLEDLVLKISTWKSRLENFDLKISTWKPRQISIWRDLDLKKWCGFNLKLVEEILIRIGQLQRHAAEVGRLLPEKHHDQSGQQKCSKTLMSGCEFIGHFLLRWWFLGRLTWCDITNFWTKFDETWHSAKQAQEEACRVYRIRNPALRASRRARPAAMYIAVAINPTC